MSGYLIPLKADNCANWFPHVGSINNNKAVNPLKKLKEVQPAGTAIQQLDLLRKYMIFLQVVDCVDPDAIIRQQQVAHAQDQRFLHPVLIHHNYASDFLSFRI